VDESAEVLEALAAERAAARACVLATVTATSGSAPRAPGAKMLVRADGTIAGTVGGGPLEAMAIATARELLADAAAPPRKETFQLQHRGPTSLKMRCGGTVEIFFDVHRPPAAIVVLGGGHVGRATAAVSVAAGIPTILADDRPEFADPARVPGARAILADLRGAAPLAAVPIAAGDAVVIVTRCHDVDEGVLAAALATPAAYVGMIGSRRKVAEIFRNLAARGLDAAADPRVHAPIGLAIGGSAPGEIAVSILAEILKLRSGRDASHLRATVPAGSSSARRAAPAAAAVTLAARRGKK